jgi:hypothetical protein
MRSGVASARGENEQHIERVALVNSDGMQFFANLSVGHPPQHLTVLVATGANTLVLFCPPSHAASASDARSRASSAYAALRPPAPTYTPRPPHETTTIASITPVRLCERGSMSESLVALVAWTRVIPSHIVRMHCRS